MSVFNEGVRLFRTDTGLLRKRRREVTDLGQTFTGMRVRVSQKGYVPADGRLRLQFCSQVGCGSLLFFLTDDRRFSGTTPFSPNGFGLARSWYVFVENLESWSAEGVVDRAVRKGRPLSITWDGTNHPGRSEDPAPTIRRLVDYTG